MAMKATTASGTCPQVVGLAGFVNQFETSSMTLCRQFFSRM
jgi:hypothetical protein